jgi:hypothetical protein
VPPGVSNPINISNVLGAGGGGGGVSLSSFANAVADVNNNAIAMLDLANFIFLLLASFYLSQVRCLFCLLTTFQA